MSFVQAAFLGIFASSVVLIIGTVRAARTTPSVRPADAPTHDTWEIAFLAGGPGRVADAAIAGMHADGRLTVGGPGVVTVRQAHARDAVEAAVLDAVARTPGGALASLRADTMRSPAVQEIGDRLAARGLMRRPEFSQGWRRFAGIHVKACVVVLAVGVLLTVTGAADDAWDEAPTMFRIAPAVIVGVIVGSLCKRAFSRRVTKAGFFALRTARAADAPGVMRPVGVVVALGGAALIADEALRQHLAEAQRATASASSSAASSASGGSSGTDSGWGSPFDGSGASWCGSSSGGSGSGCGSSSCGGGSSSGGGSSCGGGGSSCGGGGSSCGGGS